MSLKASEEGSSRWQGLFYMLSETIDACSCRAKVTWGYQWRFHSLAIPRHVWPDLLSRFSAEMDESVWDVAWGRRIRFADQDGETDHPITRVRMHSCASCSICDAPRSGYGVEDGVCGRTIGYNGPRGIYPLLEESDKCGKGWQARLERREQMMFWCAWSSEMPVLIS